jgi:2-polyprenyl-3-methyl-5-hydroxy-6-metoxy-1,4-benzoquinol methylase
MEIDSAKLDEFLGRFVGDLGATLQAGTIVIGDRLGLYRALDQGPATSSELAARTRTAERYVREWLRGQASGGYVSYDPATDHYWLSPEQSFALAQEGSPAFIPGAFQVATAAIKDEALVAEAFRSGHGVGWHQHHPDLFVGTERFFRPGYAANLVDAWLPALPGTVDKLTRGAQVADVGCGHGASTILMAQAFPRSSFVGFDYHEPSIRWAEKAAGEAGVSDRVTFEVAGASEFGGSGYDLVAFFDCLHDMGDPVGAARRVRSALAPDGSWLLVEPYAANSVADNLNPVGRVFYNVSTLVCVPNSLSQEVGRGLGAQAGEAQLRAVATEAGFGSFRRAAETPFNLIFEVRPGKD